MNTAYPDQLAQAHGLAAHEQAVETVLLHVRAGYLTLLQASELVELSPQELERRLRHVAAGQCPGQARIANVSFSSTMLFVRLVPAHELQLPLARFPGLAAATPADRRAWQLIDHGSALCWPQLGLTLSLLELARAVHEP